MSTQNYFYSPKTGGFYLEGLHESIPDDAISMTVTEWQALVEGLAHGQALTIGNKGQMLLQAIDTDPLPPAPE